MHSTNHKAKIKSFTLIELLVVLAILSIIAAIGVPILTGFINDAKETTAKNSLHSIAMIEADWRSENGDYYGTNTGNQTAVINQNLFGGKKTLDEQGDYMYYVLRTSSSSFKAFAVPKNSSSSLSKICIDHNDEIKLGARC
jgi:prepilin-type N-terminal cleavage/methylation domain-containing protein|tara:strand:- start:708 stop:1130 length:423 start_codon:yes stop_codon:yes gene_type:complete